MPPQTPIQLSRRQARRLMLARLGLWPPRAGEGKAGVVDFIRRVGSIQFDPINVVARNPDLVLQSRISGYRSQILEQLLYQDRALVDGWDKMACIFHRGDWPFFGRQRRAMAAHFEQKLPEAVQHAPEVLAAIRQHGPLSSTDFKPTASIEGFWGRPMRLANGALQYLQESGELGIHSRVGARRVYDLIENLLPPDLLGAPEPHPVDRDYHRWHLLRRTNSMGVVQERAGVHWSGVLDLDSSGRRKLLNSLVEEGRLIALTVEGLKGRTCFAAADGFDSLVGALSGEPAEPPEVSLIAPLDNLLWDRDLVLLLFDFAYVWEVYKPAKSRQYGYYVLPVLYGDQIVGRCEPRLDRASNTLKLVGWWWEDGFDPNDSVREAVSACLTRFAAFSGATRIEVLPEAEGLVRMGYSGMIDP